MYDVSFDGISDEDFVKGHCGNGEPLGWGYVDDIGIDATSVSGNTSGEVIFQLTHKGGCSACGEHAMIRGATKPFTMVNVDIYPDAGYVLKWSLAQAGWVLLQKCENIVEVSIEKSVSDSEVSGEVSFSPPSDIGVSVQYQSSPITMTPQNEPFSAGLRRDLQKGLQESWVMNGQLHMALKADGGFTAASIGANIFHSRHQTVVEWMCPCSGVATCGAPAPAPTATPIPGGATPPVGGVTPKYGATTTPGTGGVRRSSQWDQGLTEPNEGN